MQFTWPAHLLNAAPEATKKKRNWEDTADSRRLRAADVSVVGDVGDCIGHCVYTLRVLVRNFDGELFLDGKDNLRARA